MPLDSHQPCSALRAPLPGYSHHLLVLAGAGECGAPPWDADALQQAAAKVVWPLRVTWFKGAEAGTLGGHHRYTLNLRTLEAPCAWLRQLPAHAHGCLRQSGGPLFRV